MNNAALERLASVTERVQSRPVPSALEQKAPVKEEAYRWKATTITETNAKGKKEQKTVPFDAASVKKNVPITLRLQQADLPGLIDADETVRHRRGAHRVNCRRQATVGTVFKANRH